MFHVRPTHLPTGIHGGAPPPLHAHAALCAVRRLDGCAACLVVVSRVMRVRTTLHDKDVDHVCMEPLVLCTRCSSAGTLSANGRRQYLAAATPCRSACPACPSCWLPALPLQPLWRRGTPAHGARRWPRSSPPRHTISLRAYCRRWRTAWQLRVSADVTLATLSACAASGASLLGPSRCRKGLLCSLKCRFDAWRHALLHLPCTCQPPICAALSLPLCPVGMPHAATLCCICGGDVDAAVRQWGKAAVSKDGAAPSVDALEVRGSAVMLPGWGQYWAGGAQGGWYPA